MTSSSNNLSGDGDATLPSETRKSSSSLPTSENDNGDDSDSQQESSPPKKLSVEADLPSLLDGEFYEVQLPIQKDGSVSAVCKNCVYEKKIIKGHIKSTGNFMLHVKRQHPSLVKKAKEKRLSSVSKPRGVKRKLEPHTFFASPQTKRCVTQSQATESICNLIIEETLPLSTVEKPRFRELIATLTMSNPVPIYSPDRKSLASTLIKKLEAMKIDIKNTFEEAKYACTTGDIWSHNNKSYLGVTGHCLSRTDFKRTSFALACRRIKYPHTSEVIAESLQGVHDDFKLTDIVTRTTTDNAANFAKAFRCYSAIAIDIPAETSELRSFDQEDKNEDELHEDEFNVDGYPEVSELELDSDSLFSLPPELRCYSHTLNLVATTDVDTTKQSAPSNDSELAADFKAYKSLHRQAFSKMQALWNKISRSTAAADLVESVCGTKFSVPNRTRWNALFDSTKKILAKKEKLPQLFEALKLPPLKSSELEFLSLWVEVMEPVSAGLDILQEEENCYMGTILPTLLSIKLRLESKTNLKCCRALRFMLLQGLTRRFANILDFSSALNEECVVASVSHPRFKLSWVPEDKKDGVRSKFIDACNNIFSGERGQRGSGETPTTPDIAEEQDFFSVLQEKSAVTSISDSGACESQSGTFQALQFLQDNDKNLQVLSKYPAVKEVFLKHNTAIPSFAPVERLFSDAGIILTARLNRLSDKNFEMFLMLRANRQC